MHPRSLLAATAITLALASAASAQVAPPAALSNPARLTAQALNLYTVKFDTSAGVFVVEVHRDWAPLGADRFYNLVKNGYYDDCRFFRVIPGFMVQFGIHGVPAVNAVWRGARIGIDPVKESNKRGYISFAMGGTPDTRTTQVFINFSDNTSLDRMGFAPFAMVLTGMEVVDKIYSGYGEGAPRGASPDQGRIQAEGNVYLNAGFPKMDYVKTARIQ